MLCDDLEGCGVEVGVRKVHKGGDICTLIVDSCCCTTLQSNSTPIKINK